MHKSSKKVKEKEKHQGVKILDFQQIDKGNET